MKRGIITNRNKFVLGPSGSGKSFFMNHLVRQYYEQGTHVLLVDTGNSYQGLCSLIHRKTKGEDGIYFTYTEEEPISFNPFYTDDGVFDVEKKDSIKTLLLTLWKGEEEKISKTESGELGSAVSAYIRLIGSDKEITPNFKMHDIMSSIESSELENKDSLVREIVDMSLEPMHNTKCSKELLENLLSSMNEEKEKIFEKDTLELSLSGKDPLEKARILAEYNRRRMKAEEEKKKNGGK